jgi:hypothetical protein
MKASYKRIVASIGTTIFLIALAIPAAAIGPIRFHQTVTFATNWECPGGVLLPGTVTFTINGLSFRDADNQGTRLFFHTVVDQSYVGPTGVIASGTNVQNQVLDVNTRASATRGLITNLRVDGVIVAHVAGQIKVDAEGNATFTQSFAHAQPEGVCAALLP